MREERLSGIIDFGQLAVGDPECDFVIAWTLFEGKNREFFRAALDIDLDTWTRAKAWTLWKALITAADFTNTNNTESMKCWHIIDANIKG